MFFFKCALTTRLSFLLPSFTATTEIEKKNSINKCKVKVQIWKHFQSGACQHEIVTWNCSQKTRFIHILG